VHRLLCIPKFSAADLVFEETTSIFGAEFVAMKNGMETISRGLRIKLHMMGIPIDGPAFVYEGQYAVGDSQYAAPRVHVEEEIKLCLLPALLQRVGCNE
jgi:hypothetical protein